MAMNPMQRRARNSFLTGVLITLIIMAVAVVILLDKINKLNEDKEKLIALQKKYYVLAEDVKSGDEITEDKLVTETVQTTVSQDENLTPTDFYEVDDDGNEFLVDYVSKLDLPAGTIITKNMVSEVNEKLENDQRIQEYSMIILPSQLVEGDYIDIRFEMPSGVDYIVLSKKKVLKCNQNTVWLKMSEGDLLTLNNAIVESYQAEGSKLYATTYIEAGIQEAAIANYPVNPSVLNLIQRNPNIVVEAKNALISRYNNEVEGRMAEIDSSVAQNKGAVQEGIQKEVDSLRSERENFLSQLDGENGE